MIPIRVRRAIRYAVAVACTAAAPVAAQQATTTGAVRGVVTGADGTPVDAATVIAINVATGVRRGAQTDEGGRYQIPFLDPGQYTVRAQRIGFRPVERLGFRIAIGQVEKVDFQLTAAPVELQGQTIVAEQVPLIETNKTGTSTRIDETQIAELPVNGRNFKDLVVLAPGVSDVGNTGSGGGQSIGGGRTGGTNILMDGANNNESFFGGDARGGDRAPFSYSIEAVKEIQVITAGYDVERGHYTGGTVNAVTKSGTNRFSGSVFGYLRQDEFAGVRLTGDDYFGRPPADFRSQQYGFSLGGPIIKDRAHFFFSLDRQVRDDPRPIYVGDASDAGIRAAGIHPDTLERFLDISQSVHGLELRGEVGALAQNTNENAFFGRVDWQLSDAHLLTLRHNYTNTHLTQDRLFSTPSSSDLLSNAGNNDDVAHSFVASLNSVFRGGFSNEFRFQFANEEKPRESNPAGQFGVPLPEVRINNVTSQLSDGSTVITQIRFGADPVLHHIDLSTRTIEVIDNVRLARGSHTFKLGFNYLGVHALNRFGQNFLGTWEFDNLATFEQRRPSRFTRTLPFTPGGNIEAEFDFNEFSTYLQDEWQFSPRLFLTYGLRYDNAWSPFRPEGNPLLARTFPTLEVGPYPRDGDNFSPRFGFTFDPNADGRQIVRGGTGVFYGRAPYVLWSNALLTTGRTQLSLTCTGDQVPVPDFEAIAQDRSAIPTQCLAGAGPSGGTPDVNVFDRKYEQSFSWKTNLAYERLVTDNWRVGVEGVYSTIRDNYLLQDDNFNPVPRFTIEGGIPVFVDPATINANNGSVNRAGSRRDAAFDRVWVLRSLGSSETWQGILQANGRTSWGGVYATYTYDRTIDNSSRGCCTLGTMWGEARVSGNPNNYDNQFGPSEWSRTHTIVVSPRFYLPWGFQVSGIVRLFSGTPYTPKYNFDINGDGQANDRVYVPTAAQVTDTSFLRFVGATDEDREAQQTLLENLIRSNECLSEQRGRVVDRNSCRNPWQHIVDARLSKQFQVRGGQTLELVADFFNVLNGLNDDWGKRMTVEEANTSLLIPSGFANNRYTYRVNPSFGTTAPATNFVTTQFQMQLGLRLNF